MAQIFERRFEEIHVHNTILTSSANGLMIMCAEEACVVPRVLTRVNMVLGCARCERSPGKKRGRKDSDTGELR